jgi:hypothetical protein
VIRHAAGLTRLVDLDPQRGDLRPAGAVSGPHVVGQAGEDARELAERIVLRPPSPRNEALRTPPFSTAPAARVA